MEHGKKRVEGAGGVARHVVESCVEVLGVLALPLSALLRYLLGLAQRGKLSPARCAVRHALVLSLVFGLVPTAAYASTLVGTYDVPTDAVTVACDYLGYDYDTMDNGLKTILFNSDTTSGSGTDTNPNFPDFARFRNSLSSPAIYGDRQWYSSYNGFGFVDVVDKARKDIAAAVRWWDEYGGETSGGEDGELGGSFTSPVILHGIVGKYPPNTGRDVTGIPFNMALTDNQLRNLNTLTNGKYTLIEFHNTMYGTYCAIYVSSNPISMIYENAESAGLYKLRLYGNEIYYTTIQVNIAYDRGDYLEGNVQGAIATSGSLISNPDTFGFNYNNVRYLFSTQMIDGGGEPSGGPIPDEPPTIQPPSSGPTFSPTVDIHDNGNVTDNGTVVYDVDLSAITERLDVINENLTAFAQEFHTYWEWWADTMTEFVAQLGSQTSQITTWLQMIYDRLGYIAGILNSNLNDFDNDYLPNIPNGITPSQQLGEDVQRLTAKFPFSIPWDLYAVAVFLEAPAQAVVFDWPIPWIGTVHIDLSVYDDVAAVSRMTTLLMFGVGLLMRTRDMLDSLPKVGG